MPPQIGTPNRRCGRCRGDTSPVIEIASLLNLEMAFFDLNDAGFPTGLGWDGCRLPERQERDDDATKWPCVGVVID